MTPENINLRDYFAAQAMPLAMKALQQNWDKELPDGDWMWDEDDDWGVIASIAYDMADAMLKAREQS